jgi:hypothetical protein
MRTERTRLSRHADTAKAIDYMLKRWPAFTRFLDDGQICLTNNAAERALRGIAIGRRAWLFAGSDGGGERAAAMFTLIETAKLNNVDPQAWLADVLRRIADHPASKLDESPTLELEEVSSLRRRYLIRPAAVLAGGLPLIRSRLYKIIRRPSRAFSNPVPGLPQGLLVHPSLIRFPRLALYGSAQLPRFEISSRYSARSASAAS